MISSIYENYTSQQKSRGDRMATSSNFDQAAYFAKIREWSDRKNKEIKLEEKTLSNVKRAHTFRFCKENDIYQTKYSRGGDQEIDELERMATTTPESTNDGSTTDGSTIDGSTNDGSTSGEFNRKRNMSNRWLKTNTPGSGK